MVDYANAGRMLASLAIVAAVCFWDIRQRVPYDWLHWTGVAAWLLTLGWLEVAKRVS
jgi:hypothetical protein